MSKDYPKIFNSCVNQADRLKIYRNNDSDIIFKTYLDGDLPHAHILIRNLFGGRDSWLFDIMADLMRTEPVVSKRAPMPNDFQIYAFCSEADRGTHFKVAIAESAFGIQTVCHDESATYSMGAMQGKGPMVWFSADKFQAVHARLKKEFEHRGEACQSFRPEIA